MDKKYCIFDMDGTLVDSMHFWQSLGQDYLHAQGVNTPDGLLCLTESMTMPETAAYFMQEIHLPGPPEAIIVGMEAIMSAHYRADVPLKPGAGAYLAALKAQGVQLCVATATAEPLANACLTRLGIAQSLDFVVSCERLGRGKNHPDIFLHCAARFGVEPSEIAVFEDSFYAAETAKRAGFYTVGLFDVNGAANWPRMLALCDETVADWRDAVSFGGGAPC